MQLAISAGAGILYYMRFTWTHLNQVNGGANKVVQLQYISWGVSVK